MGKVSRIAVSLPTPLLEEFEGLISRKAYLSRSKAVGDAIRTYVADSSWAEGKGCGLGIIAVLYDHTARGVTEKIVEIQHAFHGLINSNTHLHLDRENCLEVLIIKADSKKINSLASKLQSLRGVKQTKLIKISP